MLYMPPCDLRLGFDGLVGLVTSKLQESVKSGILFVFSNRRRTRLKLLYWDGSGLWVMTKRLEQGCFAWPKPSELEQGQMKLPLSPTALAMLTDGIDLQQGRQRRWLAPPSGSPGAAAPVL